jgi:hypothetical protein
MPQKIQVDFSISLRLESLLPIRTSLRHVLNDARANNSSFFWHFTPLKAEGLDFLIFATGRVGLSLYHSTGNLEAQRFNLPLPEIFSVPDRAANPEADRNLIGHRRCKYSVSPSESNS